jgi:hypothetical protein
MFRVTIVAPKGRVADNKIASKGAILGVFQRDVFPAQRSPLLAKDARNGHPSWDSPGTHLRRTNQDWMIFSRDGRLRITRVEPFS